MDVLLADPRFAAHTFVVMDFEGLTPTGRPPEPIEVAALALRVRGGVLERVGCFESLIRPPADLPFTSFELRTSGITEQDLRRAEPASAVMARLDALLRFPPYRLVAQSATVEGNFIARQRAHCPTLAAAPLLDTVRMARRAVPGLAGYGLDLLLGHYGIAVPAPRHRAGADTEVTAQLWARLLADGAARGCWGSLFELEMAAAVQPRSAHAARAARGEQDELL